ncbi:MAG: Excalibur domain protein [Actinomycetia bacterium]|nr:Excalibur domain protein [Actinomycetes bacterium]
MVAAVVSVGCTSAPSASRATTTTTTTTIPGSTATGSRTPSASLTVAPDRAQATYQRAAFGPAWADVDHNGCDTRNDVLNRDLTDKQWRDGTHGCVVVAGTLADPYTGRTLTFVKARASEIQIDHVVSLGDAWRSGASQWSPPMREQFANDPLNLLAVDGPSNQSKGDDDASQWLPPNVAFRCAFVERQVEVKTKYDLTVTAAERGAISAVLDTCG